MLIVTTFDIPGREIYRKTIGMVKGNTIRARHVGKDIIAAALEVSLAANFTNTPKLSG